MGNRGGVLHNERQEIVRQYKSRSWITCLLEFKQRRRVVMTPGLYTELFFLDEATALAAGHRPCAECRRDRFNAFKEAWKRWSERDNTKPLLVREMDLDLQASRIDRNRAKVTYQSPLPSLPDGCMIQHDHEACLIRGQWLMRWSPEGYVHKMDRPPAGVATVLTPRPIVECLRHGYVPAIHASSTSLR